LHYEAIILPISKIIASCGNGGKWGEKGGGEGRGKRKLRIISQKGSKFPSAQVAIKVEGCYNIIDFL